MQSRVGAIVKEKPMSPGKLVLGLTTAMFAAIFAAQAVSQEGPPPAGADNGDFRQAMDQFRKQMDQQLKEQLGVSDEEWKVLQPRIEKIRTLQREARSGSGMMGQGPGGPGGPGGQGGPGRPDGLEGPDGPGGPDQSGQRQQSEVEKKASALQKLLDANQPKAEDVKVAMTAYREACTKAKEALAKARNDLAELLTVKQEAVLVLMGLLE